MSIADTRRGKLAFRANAEDGGGNGTVDHDSFETSSIVVFGLPYMKPNKLMERMQKLNPDAATSEPHLTQPQDL